MMPGLPSWASWFFLLLVGNGVCSPTSTKELRQPSGRRRSAEEPSPGLSGMKPKAPRPPLVTLRHEPKPQEPASAAGAPPPSGLRAQGDTVGYNSSSDPGGPLTSSSLQSQYVSLPLTKKAPSVSSAGAGPAKPSSDAMHPASKAGAPASTLSFPASGFLQRHPWDQIKEGSSPVLHSFFPAHVKKPRWGFLEPKAWESRNMPPGSGDFSHAPPSSYLIQSRRSYQRARQVVSHSKYSNDFNKLQLPLDMEAQSENSPEEEEEEGGDLTRYSESAE